MDEVDNDKVLLLSAAVIYISVVIRRNVMDRCVASDSKTFSLTNSRQKIVNNVTQIEPKHKAFYLALMLKSAETAHHIFVFLFISAYENLTRIGYRELTLYVFCLSTVRSIWLWVSIPKTDNTIHDVSQ